MGSGVDPSFIIQVGFFWLRFDTAENTAAVENLLFGIDFYVFCKMLNADDDRVDLIKKIIPARK